VPVTAAGPSVVGDKRKYPERPALMGAKLDWKRKNNGKGPEYEDKSCRRVYENALEAHKSLHDASVRIESVIASEAVTDASASEDYKALQEAAKLMIEGMTIQETYMREACLAHEYEWQIVAELSKESYATDSIPDRFSEKRIKAHPTQGVIAIAARRDWPEL
jgi:hypothetical protein